MAVTPRVRCGREQGHDTANEVRPGEGLGTWMTSARRRTAGRETARESRGPPRTVRLERVFDRVHVRVRAYVSGYGGRVR